ncbi:MAG: hypothetical protein C4526_08790 [Nitrospiraceae bacterium]|nr:MAG: hypothetical protein C4526_08790 [Nitrospiraceae bacterium]
MPFSNFCKWKYGNRNDVLCALVPDTQGQGTPGRDAIIIDQNTKIEHSVEITWPIDGQRVIEKCRQLNERNLYSENWDYKDISRHQRDINHTIEIAHKKALRDYHSPGGASLIFVFDRSSFWNDNKMHFEMLDLLCTRLSEVTLKVDNILLMLVSGDKNQIIELKSEGKIIKEHFHCRVL